MTFFEKLESSIQENNSLLCIGLDSDIHHIPKHLLTESDDPVYSFNKALIDVTSDIVCAYKFNSAYYEADGIDGLASLEKTLEYLRSVNCDIPIILDVKRGDISATSEHYAIAGFDYFGADALTINPFMGFDAIEPFLKRSTKGCIILCRTSNPGAEDFQDLIVDSEPLYVHIAKKVVEWNNSYHNCLLVVGATWPEQMKKIREISPDMWFLVPGIGTQGGDVETILKAGLRKDKSGLIINSGRSIIYAGMEENFADLARQKSQILRDIINEQRNKYLHRA